MNSATTKRRVAAARTVPTIANWRAIRSLTRLPRPRGTVTIPASSRASRPQSAPRSIQVPVDLLLALDDGRRATAPRSPGGELPEKRPHRGECGAHLVGHGTVFLSGGLTAGRLSALERRLDPALSVPPCRLINREAKEESRGVPQGGVCRFGETDTGRAVP